MWLNRQDADRMIEEGRAALVSGLKGRAAILSEILAGDDWSFVIKAAALAEAVLTDTIVAHLGEEKLRRLIKRLPLFGEQGSKVSVATDLGIVSKEQRRFIQKVAELRNKIAHGIDEIGFNFGYYISSADEKTLKSWQDAIVWFPVEGTAREEWRKIAIRQPRAGLQMALFQLIAQLTIDQSDTETKRKVEAVAIRTTTELLGS